MKFIRDMGLLIVFEGIDGSGKSLQHEKAAEWLLSEGRSVLALREPTDGPHGQKLRGSALEGRLSPAEELELFIEDRRWNVDKNILPALAEGKIVLLDRYYFSTIAYQSARGLDAQEIKDRNEAFAPIPDLVLLFDLDPDAALERIRKNRGETPNLFEKAEYLRLVRQKFLQLDDAYITKIDALRSIEEVWQQVEEAIKAVL